MILSSLSLASKFFDGFKVVLDAVSIVLVIFCPSVLVKVLKVLFGAASRMHGAERKSTWLPLGHKIKQHKYYSSLFRICMLIVIIM